MKNKHAAEDLVCFSHLRWNFVFQRPNHLMSRCAASRRVFFFEEPAPANDGGEALHVSEVAPNLVVAVPMLRPGDDPVACARVALAQLCERYSIECPITWFYTPMALAFAAGLPTAFTVYDCMDELTLFRGAPPELGRWERELLGRADLVFTGGLSLCRAKQGLHHAVFCFPSSVDVEHYRSAREGKSDPADQQPIPAPRLGFFGVIDERMDLELCDAVAAARPGWQLVLLGPVVKVDPNVLPRRPNIHYLGPKAYAELPRYLAGWDVAIMPFALNDATRFISPTKTLEYLAGGKPVVSTAVPDVVSPYADSGMVRIGRDVAGFIEQVELALREARLGERGPEVDALLERTSWSNTWAQMEMLMTRLMQKNREAAIAANDGEDERCHAGEKSKAIDQARGVAARFEPGSSGESQVA
jgi:glycosyltransferase involved in cell wall biosynthesis